MTINDSLISLFLSFLKIGAFTFGGGYAMIPLIKEELVERRKWLTEEEIYDIVTLAEMTPGPIAVNAATFVGMKIKGWKGAISATTAVILPSFVIISFLCFLPEKYETLPIVRHLFFGIRAAVLALILNALYRLWKTADKDFFFYVLLILAGIALFFRHLNIFLLLLSGGIAGFLYGLVGKRSKS